MKISKFLRGEMISSKEAARRGGFTNDYISKLCRDGRLRGDKIGNAWYVDEGSLNKFVETQKHLNQNRNDNLSQKRKIEYAVESSFDEYPQISESSYRVRQLWPLAAVFGVVLFASGAAGLLRNVDAVQNLSYAVDFIGELRSIASNARTLSQIAINGNLDDESTVTASTLGAAGIFAEVGDLFFRAFETLSGRVTIAVNSLISSFTSGYNMNAVSSSTPPAARTTASRTSLRTGISGSPDASAVLRSDRLRVVAASNASTLETPVLGFNTSVTIRDAVTVGGLATINNALRVSGASTFDRQIRASGGISTNNADITAGSGRVFASNIVNSITAGKNVTIAGTPQNLIISSKAASGGGSNAGGVSSIGLYVPTFLSVAGSPITSDGTLAVTYSGTALPLANGGTGTTTGGVANGVEFYNGTTLTNSPTSVFDGTNVGIGTTTPGSLLSIGGVANFTTATSTFYGQGVNLEDGCYAIGGVCITATGLGGLSSVTADYPLTGLGTAGSHLSLAFGTTTSNLWGGTQTFTNAPVFSALGTNMLTATNASGALISTSTPTAADRKSVG